MFQELIINNKQLRLHFDINKTIIALDGAQNKGLEHVVNEILAEFTFNTWNLGNKQSYYAYITDQIAQKNPELSQADELFKNKRSERLKDFPLYLKQYPTLLMYYEREKALILKMVHDKEMVIFPSFFNLITWLDKHCPKKYAIYLRTFGRELPEVMQAIERSTPLQFSGQGKFEKNNLFVSGESKSLFTFFRDSNFKHYGIHDDYAYWKSTQFQAIGGKPFPIDLNDPHTISIFFDDNANDPHRQIIQPIRPNGKLEDTAKLLKMEIIVAVNSKEAILNENYFIDQLKSRLIF